MQTMKYRVISKLDSKFIITEDGGLVEIRDAEPHNHSPNRQSTSDYYHSRLSEDDLKDKTNIFDILNSGDMSYNDWETPFDDPNHITDALEWLAPGYEYQIDENIFNKLDLFLD